MSKFDQYNVSKLSDSQAKAFKSLQRAFKKCKKENILFYTVLETVHALNGNEVSVVHDSINGNEISDCIDLSNYIIDEGLAGWADDTHYVDFK